MICVNYARSSRELNRQYQLGVASYQIPFFDKYAVATFIYLQSLTTKLQGLVTFTGPYIMRLPSVGRYSSHLEGSAAVLTNPTK